MPIDPRSTANAALAVAEHTDLLVVGAGPAGLAAALAGVTHGLRVVLVDENPVPAATMGDDVPLHWGQRMSGVVRNRTAMTEALLAARPALADAIEAGVDVRLGTIAWGLYSNGRSVSWLPGLVAGLSDGERSTMLGARAAIVAAGRRDMGLAFPGWELPGVMGATAAERLASLGALDARRAVVLGSSAEALLAARALLAAGVTVAAIVEQAAAPIGPAPLLAELEAAGVPLLTRHVIAAADGTSDVAAAHLMALDDGGHRLPATAHAIPCDTIVLGIGAIPVVELLDALGCRTAFQPDRGGHVPLLDSNGQTSIRGVYAVGDCAGVWADKSCDPAIAAAEAERAVAYIAGAAAPDLAGPPARDPAAFADYRLAWVRAAVVEAAGDAHVCQCEEVTAREILELRPPRYLGWEPARRNATDLAALLGNGPNSPDQVKRLTRAGMGLCQGRRCREQVACLMALGGATPLGEIPLATHRAPVRPMPLGLLGSLPETPEMAHHWDIWFGIPGQVASYWDIPKEAGYPPSTPSPAGGRG